MFFLDPHWNPSFEQQAISRVLRQLNMFPEVDITWFLQVDTIEYAVMDVQHRKMALQMSAGVFDNDTTAFFDGLATILRSPERERSDGVSLAQNIQQTEISRLLSADDTGKKGAFWALKRLWEGAADEEKEQVGEGSTLREITKGIVHMYSKDGDHQPPAPIITDEEAEFGSAFREGSVGPELFGPSPESQEEDLNAVHTPSPMGLVRNLRATRARTERAERERAESHRSAPMEDVRDEGGSSSGDRGGSLWGGGSRKKSLTEMERVMSDDPQWLKLLQPQ